jgi:hypothetical protein
MGEEIFPILWYYYKTYAQFQQFLPLFNRKKTNFLHPNPVDNSFTNHHFYVILINQKINYIYIWDPIDAPP